MGSPPTALAPAFRLGRRLGEGACAPVYAARHRASGIEVALKLLALTPDTPGWVIDAFRREGELMARCRGRNLASLYERGASDGSLYIAMELVDGDDLAARVEREGPLGEREALEVGLAIARAIESVAAAGVVHGDVKPRNVVGAGVLVDFGAARAVGAAPERGARSWLGSPPYVAPEVVLARSPRPEHRGRPIDVRADLYGLGVTLYAILTAASPCDASDPRAFVRWILEEEVADIRERAPHLSADIAALVRDLTRKEPDDRPTSAGDVIARIAALAQPRQERGRLRQADAP
jgi:serine/threonine protein kinase